MGRGSFTTGTATERVEAALRHVGGDVAVSELAYQTALPSSEVHDALRDLAAAGRATPSAWTLRPQARAA